MGYAAVSCARHWTAACDAIQARMDVVDPYLYGAFAVMGVVAAGMFLYSCVKRHKI